MKMRIWFKLVTLLYGLSFAIAAWLPAARAADADAFALNQRLGRGVNVLGYDEVWRHPERGRFKAEHFRAIRQAGFNHVRINLHPFRDNRGERRQAPRRVPQDPGLGRGRRWPISSWSSWISTNSRPCRETPRA